MEKKNYLKKPSSKIKKMSKIPEEIIEELIFRLPVKSLLKLRCVSSSWLSFIDSPLCVKTQLSYATQKIILGSPLTPYVLDIDTLNPKPIAKISVLELGYVVKNPSLHATIIMGSCNGLVLLFHNLFAWDVSIQNPFTKSFYKIPYKDYEWPEPRSVNCVLEMIVYGFGYDSLSDDVKVVRNVQFLTDVEKAFYSSVDVYSLKMESWKKVESFPYYVLNEMAEGVFVGGALHWVVIPSLSDFSEGIMAFDVATEKYRLVQQPIMYRSREFHLKVNELGGCLVAIYNYYTMGSVDIWVMKEYGEVESWFRVISLGATDIGVDVLGFVKPLIYSECRKKVLIERDHTTLLWYDLEKKSAESVELGGCEVPQWFNSIVVLESLAKPCHPDKKDAKRGAGKNDEKSNKRHSHRDAFLSPLFKLKLMEILVDRRLR